MVDEQRSASRKGGENTGVQRLERIPWIDRIHEPPSHAAQWSFIPTQESVVTPPIQDTTSSSSRLSNLEDPAEPKQMSESSTATSSQTIQKSRRQICGRSASSSSTSNTITLDAKRKASLRSRR